MVKISKPIPTSKAQKKFHQIKPVTRQTDMKDHYYDIYEEWRHLACHKTLMDLDKLNLFTKFTRLMQSQTRSLTHQEPLQKNEIFLNVES